MTLRTKLSIVYGALLAGVIVVAVLSFLLRKANADHETFQARRYDSIRLADELRQSSDDLTRFARTYVVTGDAKYERMYFDVLDIRNGKTPRPQGYDKVYWDLVLNVGDKPTPDSPPVPLQELLREVGVTGGEFAKLAEAQRNSDALVRTELIAMNMVKGLYDDGSGAFTRKADPDLETARRLMHDEAYHRSKMAIMKPIGEFQQMLTDRTALEVTQSMGRRNRIFFGMQVTLVMLLLLTAGLVHLRTQQQGLEALVAQRTAALGSKIAELESIQQALRESETKLRESETRYRSFVTHSSEGIYRVEIVPPVRIDLDPADYRAAISRNAVVAEVNEALALMYGLSPAEMIGRKAVTFAPDYATRAEEVIRRRDLRVLNQETMDVDTEGKPIWLWESFSGEVEDGRLARIWGVQRNITDRKRVEDDRRTLQEQLAQAQRMESVGRLAGGVAHDFNNMLGVILGHAELALGDLADSDPLRPVLEEIQKAAERSAGLTRQLLAFARRQAVAPKVIDLNETIDGTLKMLRRLIGEDIALAWSQTPGLWPVKIDPSQIDQMLANLAVNARDAIAGTPTGVGTVTIEAANVSCSAEDCQRHPGAVPGSYIRLSVSDDGCGIDTEALTHLFEPFYTTKALGKGTGLGLATVYGVVRQNDGFIEVDSQVGRGTTFRIFLPRHLGLTGGRMPATQLVAAAGGTETILLVEDEPSILAIGKTMLARLGYQVLTAGSPQEAIRVAGQHPGEIHMVLTDVVMPEMNGKELAERLTAVRPGLRCLFMSGYTSDIIAHHGVVDEGLAFIPKPFAFNDLAVKVRDVLDRAPAES